MKTRRWIFVTGAPRSGTTFVGKVLSMPLSVDYIHEPFNPDCGIAGIRQRFKFLPPETEDREWLGHVEALMRYDVRLTTGFYPQDTALRKALKRVVGSRGPLHYRLARMNPLGRHVVLKDPIGCLLTELLAKRFAMTPVVMIRHPIAFVSSYKRLGWPAQLDTLFDQPSLRERYFPDDAALLESGDPIVDTARLWVALHRVLLDQIRRNPGWIVLRHEDLNAAPVPTFRQLHRTLRLPWTPRAERRVRTMTSGANRAEARRARVQDFRRDSRSLLRLRMDGLTATEQRTVTDITASTAIHWYPESMLSGLPDPTPRLSDVSS